MKVFISWSGPRSHKVASAFRDWLPFVMNEVKPFMSSADIGPGARWGPKIARELEEAQFGVVCVTPENQAATWLNFEAGALAKEVEQSRVVPIAINLAVGEVQSPLGQFQAIEPTKAKIRGLAEAMNGQLVDPLGARQLNKAFETFWPELADAIEAAQKLKIEDSGESAPEKASEHTMLAEVLATVRSIGRFEANREPPASYGQMSSRTERDFRMSAERLVDFVLDMFPACTARIYDHDRHVTAFSNEPLAAEGMDACSDFARVLGVSLYFDVRGR